MTRQTTFEEFEAVEVQGEEARIFHQTKINRRAYTEKHQGTPEATFFAITAPSVVQITKGPFQATVAQPLARPPLVLRIGE